MNPLRWEVLAVSLVLALPLFALGLRGDLSLEEVTGRLPWCLAAGWGAVSLLRWAAVPRVPQTPLSEPPATAEDAVT